MIGYGKHVVLDLGIDKFDELDDIDAGDVEKVRKSSLRCLIIFLFQRNCRDHIKLCEKSIVYIQFLMVLTGG